MNLTKHSEVNKLATKIETASYKFATGDPDICECCEEGAYIAWTQGRDWKEYLSDMTV